VIRRYAPAVVCPFEMASGMPSRLTVRTGTYPRMAPHWVRFGGLLVFRL
jgi:hypothetical protein